MDPTLIKANIALYNGSRSEARRLLESFSAENPRPEDEIVPLLMWMEAQSQDDSRLRLEKLQALADKYAATSPYGRFAADYLAQERQYASKGADSAELPVSKAAGARSLPRVFGVDLWKVLAFGGIGVLIGAVIWAIIGGTPREDRPLISLLETPVSTSAPTFTPPPDRSVRLAPEDHSAQFDRGRVEVSAYEDGSERIADLDGVPLRPIQGTRFYALRLGFECLGGAVCADPPEARLSLLTSDGAFIDQLRGAGVIGEPLLQPVGSGSRTNGWVVFELPAGSSANSLIVLPDVPAGQESTPIAITLAENAADLPTVPVEETPE